MPFYEFRCQDCGHQFTKNVSWLKKHTLTCPKCDSRKLQEVFGLNYLGSKDSGSSGAAGGGGGGCSPFG